MNENRVDSLILLRRLLGAFGALGFISFLVGMAMAMGAGSKALRGKELPLGDVGGLAVDSRGRIYVGAQGYSRVQVYSSEGRFLNGWHVDASGGVFRLCVDERDLLHVATARNDLDLLYDENGRLLKSRKNDQAFYDIPEYSAYRARGQDGREYRILKWSVIWPRIVRVNGSGRSTVVVRTPVYLWLVMGPLPAWLFLAVAIVALKLMDWWQRRYEPRDRSGTGGDQSTNG